MIVQYNHHGKNVFVDSETMGTHRDYCLCFKCASFTPGEANTTTNCPIAQELYQLCVKNDLVTPVFECPKFVKI